MDTVNGLSAAQVQALLEPLADGPWIQKENSGKVRLRHEYVRAQLTRIFGFNGWGMQNLGLNLIADIFDSSSGERVVIYGAQTRLILRNDDGSTRNFFDGSGAWHSVSTRSKQVALGELHSDAMNGAASVALCRAVINLGEQFGLTFYTDNLPTATVGYSLPHIDMLSNVYGAGDVEDPPEIEAGQPQYTEEETADATP
jgi:hypothetical protein